MIDEKSIAGHNNQAFEAAMEAFLKGDPGVLRRIQLVDSYPGESESDPEGYADIKTTHADERKALAVAINAYLEKAAELDREGFNPPGTVASVRVRPARSTHGHRTITVRTMSLAGGGPYQDKRDTYEVTFTGGTRSSVAGQEIPFATMPPFDRSMHESRPGMTVKRFPPKTIEELEIEHNAHIKRIIAAVIPGAGWETDKTIGEPSKMGGRVLERFEHVRGSAFEHTWRVIVCTPFMD